MCASESPAAIYNVAYSMRNGRHQGHNEALNFNVCEPGLSAELLPLRIGEGRFWTSWKPRWLPEDRIFRVSSSLSAKPLKNILVALGVWTQDSAQHSLHTLGRNWGSYSLPPSQRSGGGSWGRAGFYVLLRRQHFCCLWHAMLAPPRQKVPRRLH